MSTNTYTEADLAVCLEAIQDEHPDAEVLQLPWVDIVLEKPDGRCFYLTAQDPSTLEVGSIYVTWVVELHIDGRTKVSYFRSRRGELGDDTLPP